MEKISITTQLLNQVLGYLGTRPYQEVYQLISAIQDEAKDQIISIQEKPEVVPEE
jgi:hypothetical protein